MLRSCVFHFVELGVHEKPFPQMPFGHPCARMVFRTTDSLSGLESHLEEMRLFAVRDDKRPADIHEDSVGAPGDDRTSLVAAAAPGHGELLVRSSGSRRSFGVVDPAADLVGTLP